MNKGQVVILQRYHFIPNNFNNNQLHSHPQPQQLTFTPTRLGTSVSLARASFALTFFVAYQLRVESHEISNSLNGCSPGSSRYSSTNSQNRWCLLSILLSPSSPHWQACPSTVVWSIGFQTAIRIIDAIFVFYLFLFLHLSLIILAWPLFYHPLFLWGCFIMTFLFLFLFLFIRFFISIPDSLSCGGVLD